MLLGEAAKKKRHEMAPLQIQKKEKDTEGWIPSPIKNVEDRAKNREDDRRGFCGDEKTAGIVKE